MTQEDKQLLLKDLCARFSYGTIYNDIHGDSIVTYIDLEESCVYLPDFDECRRIEDIKPYLRPMSSMTEEEATDFEILSDRLLTEADNTKIWNSVVDWLNEHHFDHRGLIEKGLALEVPEGMYKS